MYCQVGECLLQNWSLIGPPNMALCTGHLSTLHTIIHSKEDSDYITLEKGEDFKKASSSSFAWKVVVVNYKKKEAGIQWRLPYQPSFSKVCNHHVEELWQFLQSNPRGQGSQLQDVSPRGLSIQGSRYEESKKHSQNQGNMCLQVGQ